MELLMWETEEEVEDGMFLAFGAHRPANKYPLYMTTKARLQLVKRSTLGIDPSTGKYGYIGLWKIWSGITFS